MKLRLASIALVACVGCGEHPPAQNNPPPRHATTATTPVVSPSGAEPPHADFGVHEWGVFDVAHGSPRFGALRAAPSTAAPEPPASVLRKPVLYVHLPTNAEPLEFAIGVNLSSGVIAENFPDGTLSAGDRGVTWSHITARSPSCHNAQRFTLGDADCSQTSDGVCERTELAHYETNDSACLLLGGVEHNHLFYRARNIGIDLPIVVREVVNAGVSSLVAANSSARSLAGILLRARTDGTGIAVESLSTPAPGQSIPLWDAVTTRVDGRAVLREATRAQGLSDPEVDAFMRAWADELFGPEQGVASRESVRRDTRMPARGRGLPAQRDELLYFIPDYVLERVAPLTIMPAPSTVHRAILVRMSIRDSITR